jgi:hypothetical protein
MKKQRGHFDCGDHPTVDGDPVDDAYPDKPKRMRWTSKPAS